jgi:glycosyltransferase involved in cell wall biosynthesis
VPRVRIALLSTPFIAVPPRAYGGTELVVHELAEGLVARGHDVTLFATGDSHTSARLRFLYARSEWPPDPIVDTNHAAWAMETISGGHFDIIHAHAAVALAFRRLVANIPLVYTIHHPRAEATSAYYARYPDVQFVAISADQAARESRFPEMTVIHHGLDPARYEWTDHPGDYVCFIGRFAACKGTRIAIDVAGAAGAPIRIAGDCDVGDSEYARRDVVPALSLPHVTYLGSIGAARKTPLLRDARALLAPLAWHEPFGLIMIEAMLSGCPVVAFPLGSAPELIEPGVTGFLACDAAEMTALVRPRGAIDTFDRAACRRRAVERFSHARMVGDYERLYASVAERAIVRAA